MSIDYDGGQLNPLELDLPSVHASLVKMLTRYRQMKSMHVQSAAIFCEAHSTLLEFRDTLLIDVDIYNEQAIWHSEPVIDATDLRNGHNPGA